MAEELNIYFTVIPCNSTKEDKQNCFACEVLLKYLLQTPVPRHFQSNV